MTREGAQPGVRKQQPLAAMVVGQTAKEKAKEMVAVLQARAVYNANTPPLPLPQAMEMLSKEEMATALRQSKEDAGDTVRHQWLVKELEEDGAK
jgi:hypothetical protein